MCLLEAKGLVKKYHRRTVVNRIDYQVNSGEIVGLLGPNGAGKTTSFRMTVGMIVPDEGQIFFEGKDITRMPMYKRAQLGLGYLAQEPSIFRNMTCEQNILAVLEMRGLGRRERRKKTEAVLTEMNILHLGSSKADKLSGGERRRLEIARAMVLEPKLILLDEPFSGVDPIAVAEIQKIITHLAAQGIGILLTDHNVRETLAITDRSYILGEGQVLVQGTSEDLVNHELAREVYLGTDFTMQGVDVTQKAKTFLHKVRTYKSAEVAKIKETAQDLKQKALDAPKPRDFAGALRSKGISLIAEIKKASPSAGLIRENFDPAALAGSYEAGGANALSVLTDQPSFQGDLAWVGAAHKAAKLPILRKDFIIDDIQVYEARAAGADAVLLIVNMLNDQDLRRLLALAGQLHMAALVEVHDETEICRALDVGAEIIGINNRNLHTLEVDIETCFRLRNTVPDDKIIVAESGILDHQTMDRLERAGFHAALVGESLMRQTDVAEAVRKLMRQAQNL